MRTAAHLLSVALLSGSATAALSATNAIINFGKVNGGLYRGGQPDFAAMQQLKALGVKSVINLRMPDDVWKLEPAVAAASAMVYTNIPLETLSAPTDEQVARVLAAIAHLPKPVFVHCQYGSDRTGTIIACYRIRQDRWETPRALKEADVFGLSPLQVEKRQFIQLYK